MKNPYDIYLLRRKPRLLGLYLGKPVYDGDENSAEFRRIIGEAALPKIDSDVVPQAISPNKLGDGFAFFRVALILLFAMVIML